MELAEMEPQPATPELEQPPFEEQRFEEPSAVETSFEEPVDAAPAGELPRRWTRPGEDTPAPDEAVGSVEAAETEGTLAWAAEVSEPASAEQPPLPAQTLEEP